MQIGITSENLALGYGPKIGKNISVWTGGRNLRWLMITRQCQKQPDNVEAPSGPSRKLLTIIQLSEGVPRTWKSEIQYHAYHWVKQTNVMLFNPPLILEA